MSHFSVSLNALLERLQATAGLTQNAFAERIGMPVQTLRNYLDERLPDAKQLGRILSGVEAEDARLLILARVKDDVPSPWCDELLIIDRAVREGQAALPDHADKLPASFLRHLELLRVEAASNPALIDLVKDLVDLLGLAVPSAFEPPCTPQSIRTKRKGAQPKLPASGPKVPARVVVTGSPPISTTPMSPHALNEAAPARPPIPIGPRSRATGSRAALKRMVATESGGGKKSRAKS